MALYGLFICRGKGGGFKIGRIELVNSNLTSAVSDTDLGRCPYADCRQLKMALLILRY